MPENAEFLGGDEPYSKEHMKNKLMKTLNEDIVITNIQGKDSVVSIRVTAEKNFRSILDSTKTAK